MHRSRAFCFPNGVIEFAPRLPRGATLIAVGRDGALRRFITVHARHAYKGDELLVPGVPEATSDLEKTAALEAWLDRLNTIKPAGIVVI